MEVREFLLDFRKVFQVEGLHQGAGTIEEAYWLAGLEGLEQVHDVASEGSHTGTTAHKDVFLGVGVVFREKELSVRAGNHHLVTRLSGEHIGGGNSRRHAGHELEHALGLGTVERRGCDTYVQLDEVLFGRVRSHGVSADGGNGVLVLQGSDAVLLPVALVDIGYAHIGKVGLIFGDINLDVFTGLEVNVLALGETDGEFLDEGGHVLVGDNLAFQLLHAQGAFRNGNLDVVFYLHLATQAPAFLNLLAGEEARFGGEDGAAAFNDLQFALAAVGLAAAGGGEEDAVIGQGVHHITARGDFQFLGAAIDVNLDGTGRGEGALDPKQQGHQDEGYDGGNQDSKYNCITHSASSLQ